MAAIQSGLLRLAPGKPSHSQAPFFHLTIMVPVMSHKALSELPPLLC